MIRKEFGILPDGTQTYLYTIRCGKLSATITDYGAHLVSLFIPDRQGNLADVVLGYDDANGYRTGNGGFLGAIVGRNANRVRNATFMMGDIRIRMRPNENEHNLHSGPNVFYKRMWDVIRLGENFITLRLLSPQGDQGFPGSVRIDVTYRLDSDNGLHIVYEGLSDNWIPGIA